MHNYLKNLDLGKEFKKYCPRNLKIHYFYILIRYKLCKFNFIGIIKKYNYKDKIYLERFERPIYISTLKG